MTTIIVKKVVMPSSAKDRMIDGAIRLLATRGLQETSFNEVIELTKTSRGSIYHHFPQGKNQMIAEAIARAGSNTHAALAEKHGSSAIEISLFFLGLWRELLVRSEFRAGCSVLAVTIATNSPLLLDQAAVVFRQWRTQLSDLLVAGGLSAGFAPTFAAQLIASCEGAIAMSRAEKNIQTFDLVADSLMNQLNSLLNK